MTSSGGMTEDSGGGEGGGGAGTMSQDLELLVDEGGQLLQALSTMETREGLDLPESILHSITLADTEVAKGLRQHIAERAAETLIKVTSVWVAYQCRRGENSNRPPLLPLMNAENKVVDALRILCMVGKNEIFVIDRKQQDFSESQSVMLLEVVIQSRNRQVLVDKLKIAADILTARLESNVYVWLEDPKDLTASLFQESASRKGTEQKQVEQLSCNLRGKQVLREGSIFVLQKQTQSGSKKPIKWKLVHLVVEESDNSLQMRMFSSVEECREYYDNSRRDRSPGDLLIPLLSVNLRGACFGAHPSHSLSFILQLPGLRRRLQFRWEFRTRRGILTRRRQVREHEQFLRLDTALQARVLPAGVSVRGGRRGRANQLDPSRPEFLRGGEEDYARGEGLTVWRVSMIGTSVL